MTYKQSLLPWRVCRLMNEKWHDVNSYRTPSDAEVYARLLRKSTTDQVKVVYCINHEPQHQ